MLLQVSEYLPDADEKTLVSTLHTNTTNTVLHVRTQHPSALCAFLATHPQHAIVLHTHLLSMLNDHQQPWTTLHGALLALPSTLDHLPTEREQSTLAQALALLEHPEPRVRQAVAQCLQALARKSKHQDQLWDAVVDTVLPPLRANMERESEGSALHDTEGWKSLETCFQILERVLQAVDTVIVQTQLVDLVLDSVTHTNRFVRETCFLILGTIISRCPSQQLAALLPRISHTLFTGLADNWSQVRFSASVSTRSLLSRASSSEQWILTSPHLSALFPPMCLNRYYVAEGVRLYSIDSWRMLTVALHVSGADLVAQHIGPVVDFYLDQAQADNHAVREAVCYCLGELGTKIKVDAVRPQVPRVLAALIDAFKDQSWPVRDSAATALGDFVLGFPDECLGRREELLALWEAHLSDNIASVREDTAVAMGKALDAFECVEYCERLLDRCMQAGVDQPEDSRRFDGLSKGKSRFGVVPSSCEDDAHTTDQVLYSCGSLAPKLKRGGGCMDHGFTRPQQPWELCDGGIHLLREFAQRFPDRSLQYVGRCLRVGNLDHFGHHVYLKETLWKNMPALLKSWGVHSVVGENSEYRQEFIEIMAKCRESGHRLAVESLVRCEQWLREECGCVL